MGTSQTRLWHSHNTLVRSRHGKALKKKEKKKKKKERTRFLTDTSLFLLVLWYDLCIVPSRSRSATIEPPSASFDPKSPSLSLCCFSLFRFWVFSLFWHFLSFYFFFCRFNLSLHMLFTYFICLVFFFLGFIFINLMHVLGLVLLLFWFYLSYGFSNET